MRLTYIELHKIQWKCLKRICTGEENHETHVLYIVYNILETGNGKNDLFAERQTFRDFIGLI